MSEFSKYEGLKNKFEFKSILFQNFILYFLLTAVLLIYYTSVAPYDFYDQSRIATLSVIVYLIAPFVKFIYEKFYLSFNDKMILHSFVINVLFLFLATIQIFFIANSGEYYWLNSGPGVWFLLYFFTGSVITFYKFRHQTKNFSKTFYKDFRLLLHFTLKSMKNITLIPFILQWWTVRSLSNNYRAVYFAKKFIILQSKSIKATLPGVMPETIATSIKGIFQNDIDRMQQLFKYNHIRIHSKSATLKFVMKIADPIIKDLQLTLEQHLTEELLKEQNDSKNLKLNVDTLWKKVEKIMVQWESTFSDAELDYKDTLLYK